MKRIVFLGTAEFGIPSLRALHEHHRVAGVVTQCDTPKGRGCRLQPSPVKIAALDMGLDVIGVENLRDPVFIERLKDYGADLFFVVAFQILPREVFTIPPDGTINLHGSLLPDYRGAAPINRAIINGDRETGLTTFYIEETIDTGDIILNEPVAIDPDETAGELSARMSELGAGLTLRTLEMIEKRGAPGLKQPMKGGRPAPKLFKEDGRIDWSGDARSIHNQVRGMNPTPGAYTEWRRGPLKIHRTKVVDEDTPGTPGMITEASPQNGFVVSCGKGKLRILELQPPGKKVMDGPSFVRGYRIATGHVLSDNK
ncbi:methionyl-tRNA formyltransferase [bacterium]|nr:methionyl-tRNA formyltransferase [bacterium]